MPIYANETARRVVLEGAAWVLVLQGDGGVASGGWWWAPPPPPPRRALPAAGCLLLPLSVWLHPAAAGCGGGGGVG